VGAENGYGLPADEVTWRLAGTVGAAKVYRTDRQGTIEFVTDGARLWVKTEKAN
jgi:beta-lactamase superfamily II metal-dependent hydrolase